MRVRHRANVVSDMRAAGGGAREEAVSAEHVAARTGLPADLFEFLAKLAEAEARGEKRAAKTEGGR